MKKVLSLLLVVSMIFIFGACSAQKTETNTDNSAKEANTEEPADVTKIVLLVSGSLGDKSFHDSSQAGMDMIKEKYGDKVEVKTIEMGSDKTKFIPTLEDVSEEEWDIIITGTFHMKEPVEEVAPNYPEKTYILFDTAVSYDEVEGLDNVYSITYKQNEAGFLAGALAAQITTRTDVKNINEEKKIGFLGAMDIPVINDFLVGYIEGGKYIDKDIKVDISYIDSFSDAAKGKELALIQYQTKGVDIGFNVAGRAGLGQIEAAHETNMYAIGVDSDQAELFADNEEKANKILSSALKRVDNSLLRAVDMYFDGTIPTGKAEAVGLEENGIGIAKNAYYEKLVPQDVREKIEEIEKEISAGNIKVSSAFGMDSETLAKLKESVK
ncbi:BMP family ABC transporter substrate-binding protein [Paramaledivibacter caminithermalis]|uniref:Nucleoside-binding protein n=1 Tax=Paramaledivibacter caminithermalis (strain DSM 15212 / CIP 107654 / DViRD3) TaxID=1121301 RepID=A0A1M6MXH3_PARC5|nr:BMP family ABC transporter substrate-binding protein [Paramaledivibacter caminithermalis]SHJ88023.1 nucleoside-binding protein [Paramaledivibacter caminithermalis DSM 15212]